MSTFYLDFEGGNDSNDGTSFANRWKTIDSGATAARIAPGDTIRVMASPNPTSLGQNGIWTDGPIGTAVSIVSSTNATPIVVTLGAGHGIVTDDTVAIASHSTNTNANGVWKTSVSGNNITLLNADGTNSVGNGVGGATGTLRKVTNGEVRLASAVTQNIACCGNQGQLTNWTASSNITCSLLTSSFKEGGQCQQIDVNASFTTGLAAYLATGTLDLSGYQQLSFWIRQSAGSIGSASDISVKLCSDVAGATPVNTFNVPALGGVTGQWTPLVIDLATNLGSSIKSIAFYVNTDNGAQTFQLDNIIACKASSSADSLNLTSLIGKNSGIESWWTIQSINGTRVMLDTNSFFNPTSTNYRGYAGATATVTTYKRETIKRTMLAAATTVQSSMQDSGTSGNLITYSGGWDRTAMSSQSGDTWLDGQCSLGNALYTNAKIYTKIDKIHFCRYNTGFVSDAANTQIGYAEFTNMQASPMTNSGKYLVAGTLSFAGAAINSPPSFGVAASITTINCYNSNVSSFAFQNLAKVGTIVQANNNSSSFSTGSSAFDITIGSITANGNSNTGILINSQRVVIGYAEARNNTGSGISHTSNTDNKILSGVTSGNTTAGISVGSGILRTRNFTSTDSTPNIISIINQIGGLYSEKDQGVADAHVITLEQGTIKSATDQRHTASGISWKFNPLLVAANTNKPLTLSIAKLAVISSSQVTINVWTRRDNTNIQGQLRIVGGQLSGVGAAASDLIVSCTPSINTWTQSSDMVFTPTEAGVLEVLFDVWDGTDTVNSFWIDDITITQA